MKYKDKLNPNSMKTQYDHQWSVFVRKNHDYGNSFEKSLDTFGLVAGIVRMSDKFERLVSLNDPSKDAQIASESLVDTLEDLSNYAAMAACWMKRKNEKNWAKKRIDAIKKEGFPVCKELEDAILKCCVDDNQDKKQFILDVTKEITDTVLMKESKGQALTYADITDNAGRIAKCIVDNDMNRCQVFGIITNYWHEHANIPIPIREFICGVIYRHIYYTKKHKPVDGDIFAEDKKVMEIKSGKIHYTPEFSKVNLKGPEKLDLDLKVDQDKLFEISNTLHPSNLPKPVKVQYGHKAVYEFPDGIDTIASYLQQLSREESKKENDRVMLDMMLSRIEKGEVVRIVANGDGSFTTYFEKTDGPFDKIVDKEDESIYHEREGWEEELKIEGQNGASVIFSDGDGVTVRSLGDITLTAGPKEKTLNEKRKEKGFDPVNGDEDDR